MAGEARTTDRKTLKKVVLAVAMVGVVVWIVLLLRVLLPQV